MKQRNQCDGCQAGLPVTKHEWRDRHGNVHASYHHHAPYPSGGMICQAEKYGHVPNYIPEVPKKKDAGWKDGMDLLEESAIPKFTEYERTIAEDRGFEEDGR